MFLWEGCHVSEKWDTNGWWPSAAAACCKTARQTTILMASCPQLMRRAVDSRAIAWRRADKDSPSATSPYIHWKLHGRYWIYSWNIVQTKMQNKIQISRHFKIKFWPLAELDPTRPDPPFTVNFLTRPDLTRPDSSISASLMTLCLRKIVYKSDVLIININ